MKHRKPLKITSRTSSVTNGFVQAILPDFPPTAEQRDALFAVLGIDAGDIRCVYCGDKATDWDHLQPLVKGKRPTGHLTDYRNLVPACGRCNQSKGGHHWRSWMSGKAMNSPAARGVADLDARIARLEDFESWASAAPVDFIEIVGPERWTAYWDRLSRIEALMREAQEEAASLRAHISRALAER